MRADGNEESINNLPVANEVAAKDYIASETWNLSIGTQYVNRLNWDSAIVSYGNEGSLNIVPVVGEEIEVKGCIADEALNFPVGMKYGNEPNSAIVSYGNEGSLNIVPVVGEEIEVKGCIADEDLNFPVGMKYGNEPNSDEYASVTYRNEDGVNSLLVVNEVVEKDSVSDEALFEQKRKLNYSDTQSKKFRESDWSPTESNFDDATLFEEMEHDGEILKDSTNPLLSSAVVSEQNTGLIPDSVWQTEYKMFSFDEDMYDSS